MEFPKTSEFILPFLSKEKVADNTFAFYFERSNGKFSAQGGPASGWDFLSGQYVRVFLPHENPDSRGINRLFTISSSPLEKERLMIITKILSDTTGITKAQSSTFKKTLESLTPGTQVRFFGPVGRFILPQTPAKPLVFLAGGIGITPYISMLSFIDQKKLPFTITLLVSFSKVEDILYQKEFGEFAKRNNVLKCIYTITQPQTGQTLWTGETGRISKELIEKYIPFVFEPMYYVVGSTAMVDATVALLGQMQIPNEQIIKEIFVGY